MKINSYSPVSFQNALQWVLNDTLHHGINILNASLVFGNAGFNDKTGWKDSYGNRLDQDELAQQLALSPPNIFIARSAGNNAEINPANIWSQIGIVGGSDVYGKNYASLNGLNSGVGLGVTVVAPAMQMTVWWLGTPVSNPSMGTSWATPLVAGTAALLKQVDPAITNQQIINILIALAGPAPKYKGNPNANWVPDPNNPISYPVLNVKKALDILLV